VRFVDEQQEVLGEEVVQRVGRLPAAARQRPAVVLDARAIADLQQHLDVEPRAGVQPLGFEQLALLAELLAAARPAPSLIASTAPAIRSSGITKCLAG
jgi:hypothetical protein